MTTTQSLFIPSVVSSADEIAAVFAVYGEVRRVDRVKQTAFVHFVKWHDTLEATDMLRRIKHGGSVKVFYDGALFWRVFPSRAIILEELPAWEDPTPDAPIPQFERRQRRQNRDILTMDKPILERQDSKYALDDEMDALLKPPHIARTLSPIEPFDFDALVTDPTYGLDINTPKTELRGLMSRSNTV